MMDSNKHVVSEQAYNCPHNNSQLLTLSHWRVVSASGVQSPIDTFWLESLFSARKQRKTRKRVSLRDTYVFSNQEVIDIAGEDELQTSNENIYRPRYKVA